MKLFAGYARYAGEKLYPLFRLTPKLLKTAALELCACIPKFRRPKLALYALCQDDIASRLVNWFPILNNDLKQKLVAENFRDQVDDFYSTSTYNKQLAGKQFSHPLDRMLYIDTKYWLVDDLLARGDKMTMAHQSKAGCPYWTIMWPNLQLRFQPT